MARRSTNIPSPALQARMSMDGPPTDEPSMIELSDGTLVSQEVFGRPPPDVPVENYDTWYENREDELLFGDETA